MAAYYRNADLITPEGFRQDGRYADEVREVELSLGQAFAFSGPSQERQRWQGEGGCRMGNSAVTARIAGPVGLKQLQRLRDAAGGSGSTSNSRLRELQQTNARQMVRNLAAHERGALLCEISVSRMVTSNPSDFRGPQRRGLAEAELWIERCFEQVLALEKFPNLIVEIRVVVEQSDGSVLACAINAVTLALVDAGIYYYIRQYCVIRLERR